MQRNVRVLRSPTRQADYEARHVLSFNDTCSSPPESGRRGQVEAEAGSDEVMVLWATCVADAVLGRTGAAAAAGRMWLEAMHRRVIPGGSAVEHATRRAVRAQSDALQPSHRHPSAPGVPGSFAGLAGLRGFAHTPQAADSLVALAPAELRHSSAGPGRTGALHVLVLLEWVIICSIQPVCMHEVVREKLSHLCYRWCLCGCSACVVSMWWLSQGVPSAMQVYSWWRVAWSA